MSVYLLEPKPEAGDDSRWAGSSYRGSCLVSAENPAAARRYVDAAYMPADAEASASPWMDEALVSCRSTAPKGEPPPTGWVRNLDTGLVTDAKTGKKFHPEWLANQPGL